MPEEPDHYEVLQVSPNAEPGVILAAYRRLAQTYHPDVNPDPRAPERMRRLNRALEILSDPTKRVEYDRRRLRRLAVKYMNEQQGPYGTLYGEHPQGWRARAARLSLGWVAIAGGLGVVVAALVMMLVKDTSDSGSGPAAAGLQTGTNSRRTAAAESAAGPSASTTPTASGSGTFSNGEWLVGEEIAPGTWRAIRSRNCSWKRLASIEDPGPDVVAGAGSSLTVEIQPNDAAFWSDGCGWWTQVLEPPSGAPEDPFGPGTWFVNEEIEPGLWQNSDSSEGCRWARLSGLDGTSSSVIGTGSGTSVVTIEIVKSDRAFDSWGCGTWTRVGD